MAFKWFYDYNVECEKALRLTKEFTGVAGDELQWLRAQIQATATTYDKEYKPVLESVDSIMSHFDVTSQEAMQVINDGFAAGADINGNFLDLIKQYAPTFADAGIKAEQFVAILTQTRSGIFSTQGLDAIRMGAARIREMGNTTAQALQKIGISSDDMLKRMREGTLDEFGALQEVAGKLKELSRNSQEYGEVMSAVFGRQGRFASQEMIEGLADIETNLDIVKEKTGEWGKAMDENRQANADFELELSSLFNVGDNGWELMKTHADTFAKRYMINVIQSIKQAVIWFANLYKSSLAFRTAIKIFSAVSMAGTKAAHNIFNAFNAGFKAMGSWIDAMVNTFKSAFKAIKNMAKGVGDILSGDINKGISEITNAVNSGISNTLKGIRNALSATKHAFSAGFSPIAEGWETGWNMPDNFFNNISFGSGSTNFFGSGDDEDKSVEDYRKLLNDLLNGKKPGGSGGNGGSSSSGSSSKNTDADAEKNRLIQLNKQLLQAAIDMELRAKRELAKVSEQGIRDYYEAQRQSMRDKYKDLGNTINDQTTAEGKAFAKLMADLNKQEEQALKDFQHNQAQTLLQKELDATGEGTDARFKKQRELLDFNFKYEQEKYKENAEMLLAIQEKYNKDVAELEAKQAKDRMDAAQKLAQAQAEGLTQRGDDLLARYKLESELLALQREQELEQYENNEEMQTAIKAKYLEKQRQLDVEYAQKEMEIQATKYNAIAAMAGGLSQVLESIGNEQKEWVILQKTLAMAEIMISQAVAIANAIKNASQGSITVWDMIAQIASGVTAVTVAMVQAFKSLDQAKFATGGYIQGAGTSTSDSIPIRVSNGESIMNANTTAMFGGLLSSLNQLGGGVPIQVAQTAQSVQGEDMLARAVARGVAMLPNPVVSVEDINKGQRQVEVMNERATL